MRNVMDRTAGPQVLMSCISYVGDVSMTCGGSGISVGVAGCVAGRVGVGGRGVNVANGVDGMGVGITTGSNVFLSRVVHTS